MNSSETVKEDGTKDCRHGGRHFGRRRWLMIPFFIGAVLLKGAAVMLLWNCLIPELFHGPRLFFGQALGLMILAKLLTGFGGGFRRFGHHGGFHRGFHRRARWMHMSPEEREKLRAEFEKRWK